MNVAIAVAAAIAAAVVPAAAQDRLNPATGRPQLTPDEVPAGVYSVIPKETLIRYEVLHFGYSDYWGTFPAQPER